ncbi:hypothetical protein A5714_02585 [Mycobacterium sp. E2462]|nr:hypothetical protein A5700_14220 [Mycobacterium sp. E1214]OBH23279.1 hypothetical protein A5693_11445 [Mycobacterium sp. E1319]OBI04837.1 hypothetical protein A5714_02585 [Mycobacterium sp. E2462]
MRMRIAVIAAAAFFLPVAPAHAAESPYQPIVPMKPGTPAMVQPLDCDGSTGDHGCGAGFHWRNGARGWACYACD